MHPLFIFRSSRKLSQTFVNYVCNNSYAYTNITNIFPILCWNKPIIEKESEHYYTPYHSYNTRLSARYLEKRTNEQIFEAPRKALDFRKACGDHNEDTYLVEEYDNFSDRLSIASSNCFKDSSESFFETQDRNLCEQHLQNTLVKFEKPMDFEGPPCADDRRRWVKNGGIVLVAAVIGWYVNHVRLQLNSITRDLDSANGRIGDIVDARLDTMYRLSEVDNMVKDLKQSQDNFKYTMQKAIEHEINKMYSDKTGRTDFALESAGGRIVQLSPGTENYGQPKNSLLGISLCEGMHGPRAMIQTGTSPGECWALKGSSGGVVVKLLGSIKIDAVSLEHISKNISPSGDSTTAPKDFTVWGMTTLTDRGALLGQFSYNIEGPLVQMFSLPNSIHGVYDFVELRILSNHGNNDFTCIYRFRVHGTMEKAKGK